MADIVIGCYVLPADASDEPDNVHALEGTVWAIERRLDEETGELVDHLHVVRVWPDSDGGVGLKFTMLQAGRVGTISPATGPTLDGLIKIAGKKLTKHGRKTELRVFGMVHALAGAAQTIPAADVPSIFDHGIDLPDGEEAGWELRPKQPHQPGQLGASMVGKLAARFEALGRTEQNEIRRDARTKGLVHLEADAELTLADVASYDVLLTRWERHNERSKAS